MKSENNGTMVLESRLADRSSWTTTGRCPIEQTMKVVGSRNAMLILREAFYGTTRFEDFIDRVGMSSATASSNLKALTGAGLLERRPYQEEGDRVRQEYVLTEAGSDLMPVIMGLFVWGSKHGELPTRVESVHAGCGEPVEVEVRCRAGHLLAPEDIELRLRDTGGESHG
ncbi:helix-turn-helix domain-containing protein [Corynebacterium nuruki]|uniref:winged helix-turn-helix transcriptional regulator n=1 Tax=Corynebacterium nuruki TaxID=1032851 RepID=UPI002FE2061B